MPDDHENLPAVPDPAAVEEAVIDGEVVDDAPLIPAPGISARPGYITALAVRHAAYIGAGVVVALRRRHERRTVHVRMARSAELSGDHESALKWVQQAELERKQRHDRRKAWVQAVVEVAKAWKEILACGIGGMGALGILLWIGGMGPRGVAYPWLEAARLVRDGIAVAKVAAAVASVAVPLGLLAWLHHLGRHAGDLAPRWAVAGKPDEQDGGLVITADTIVLALQHMPVTPLTRALKDGWKPTFSLPPVREGRGYQAAFSLPLGVTPEMLADHKPVLARNLHREPNEVWPTAGAPGQASVYVLDRGTLDKRAPEYPLLHEGSADVFEGVPGGVTARGDGVLIPVTGNNGVLGGMMGQGKSNGARVLMLGCALDPLPALDVFTFANNGDFDAFAPRLAAYRKGLDDEVIAAAVQHLEELYEDVGRREQALADLGAKKVTRGLAERYPELRPRVSLFSECHELFGHPEFGERAAELSVKTIKRARKTALVLWFDTQSSRKSAIPPALVELVSVNCCFAVKSWRSNDGFLGDGSFAAGIRATELRPGRDRGTSLVTGVSDAQFELLKWYFVEVNDDTGYDAAAEVIARAMANLAPGTPVGASMPLPAIESRDLLDDLAEVTRGDAEPVRLSVLAVRLKDLAKTWGPYRSLTGTALRQLLTDEGVRTTNTDNVPRLDPADLRSALARRDELDVRRHAGTAPAGSPEGGG